ncbi:thioesterase domain-containing protein [Thermosporothrix hazakensis]|jgi:thioesterase domain-containing protein|uniref:Thioesterase domain-containing protein n=1 Tax=Thermosporothrix hazakensis TaxID=644383 RepID=A0A326UDB1_THEHA|nr:thioesterase domain-containing protein [Thermosporothrix hazakensis]PZW32714.1 thioesterase domain-containing protein [Thermosporothrix hazakensis]GCE50070.1 hypothetical protein KTH_49390 [Thermosporothrix hazakensis]
MDERSILVSLQRGDESRLPFFCVHPAAGNVLCYRKLVQYLDATQPFYGLQVPHLYGTKAPYTCLEEIATAYRQAIQDLQPRGPYLLGGWSMGGLIAFEIAIQLQQLGEPVELLALFDTYLPDGSNWEEQNNPAMLIRYAMDIAGVDGPDEAELQQMSEEEQQAWVARLTARPEISWTTEGESQAFVQNILYQSFHNARIAAQYTLHTPFDGTITLFHTATEALPLLQQMTSTEQGHDLSVSWREFATEGVEVHMVPGEHDTMLNEPAVCHVARTLQSCLDKVQQRLYW